MTKRAWDKVTVELDFTAALERRDQGIERSAARANRAESEWTGQALGMLTAYASQVGRPFLVEEARPWAEARGLPPPPDARSWGAVTRSAIRKNRIRDSGEMARSASSNNSKKTLWVYCGSAAVVRT